MELYQLCIKEQEKILSQWLACFYKHHSIDSVAALRTLDDPFQNPLAHTTKAVLKVLFKAIIGEEIDPAEIDDRLEELMRLQSVQDLSPAHATAPLMHIKSILHKTLTPALKEKKQYEELRTMEERTDSLLLIAFNLYAQNREVIFKERIKELKNAQSQILRFAQKHK